MWFYCCLTLRKCIPLYNEYVNNNELIHPALSLVVPCYREEANLIDLHSAVESALEYFSWSLSGLLVSMWGGFIRK